MYPVYRHCLHWNLFKSEMSAMILGEVSIYSDHITASSDHVHQAGLFLVLITEGVVIWSVIGMQERARQQSHDCADLEGRMRPQTDDFLPVQNESRRKKNRKAYTKFQYCMNCFVYLWGKFSYILQCHSHFLWCNQSLETDMSDQLLLIDVPLC